MHEMSLCESIVQILEDNAKSQGFAKVKTVWLEIGGLSGVEPEAMRFSFDAVTRGTLADRARLEIIEVPAKRGACSAPGLWRSNNASMLVRIAAVTSCR